MLDSIIKFSIKNKLLIIILTLFLIIWGLWSALKLPIDAVPDITNNQIQILTRCPSLASEEVEQLITSPIEQEISNLPKVNEVRSISRFGLSVITVVFDDEVDIYFARTLVNESLKAAEERIPVGIGTPELAPVSTGLGEVYQYILRPKQGSENKYNAKDLRSMQDWIVARQLNGTPGIAEVNSFGGELKEYEVSLNPLRLKSLNVTIPEIFEALANNNENTGGAYIDKKPNAYFIRGIGMINNFEDINNIIVKNEQGGTPIFIRDVADVRFGNAVRYGAFTYNGETEAVGGIVMMLKGENSNEVVKRIKAKIPTIQKSLPSDVIIEPFLDRTDLIHRTISTVVKNLVEGALIVIFILVIFLGNLRAGLIVASAIPLSMLFALGMMKVFGISANLMSLGAIDFGLIVDGAVIIVEATLHHLGLNKTIKRFTQKQMDEEVFQSASKIRSSAAFGEIIILMVYIPILTLVGIEGKMFTPMAKTVGFAILGALILSLTYIPMMCALFLPKKANHEPSFSDRMMAFFHANYQPLLQKAISIKFWLVGVTVAAFAISLLFFIRMGSEFIPNLAEGDFAFHCILPQGSSLSQSIETSMQAMRIIKTFDEVKMVIGKTGSPELPTDPMPPEATDMMIILKPQGEWKSAKSYDQLADDIMEKLDAIPGVFYEKSQPIQMRFNELMTGIRQDVAVKIFGENMDTLLSIANDVSDQIKTVTGTTAPQVERVAGLPQINIKYDRMRLAAYGLNISDINKIISTAFAGNKAGVVYENERKFDLVVRLDSTYRADIEDVKYLYIPTKSGYQIPLSQIADISYKLGPAQISRESGKRRIVIGFNMNGRDVASVVKEIQDKLDKNVKLPTGYYFTYGGTFENLEKASQRLMIAVPISLALIFLLLYITFNSVKQASLIFTAIPMSAIGGILALMVRDMPFSISAGIGFIALFGVAVLNGIVLIGTFNQLEKEGMVDVYQRVLDGTKIRLRPVLMTALVASLGFLPMAISTSAGAEVQKPLATVVIGGLITATFLTLFILPLLYIILNNKKMNGIKLNKTLYSLLFVFFMVNENAYSQIKTYTDSDIIKMLSNNNLQLKANSLNLESYNLLMTSTNEIPKTNFGIEVGQYNSRKIDYAFQISQIIPNPKLAKAKRELIKSEMTVQKNANEIALLNLKYESLLSLNKIRYHLHKKDKLFSLDSIFKEFLNIAKVRYGSGTVKKTEINIVNSEVGEINYLIKQNENFVTQAYNQLQLLLNINENFEIKKESNFEIIPFVSNNNNTHPSINSFLNQSVVMGNQALVEKNNNLPDFNLGFTNQSLIGFQNVDGIEKYFGGSSRFSVFDAGIAIPLFTKTSKIKREAISFQIQALKTQAEYQQKILASEYANELANYENHLSNIHYLIDEAIPSSYEIVEAAKLNFISGESDYIEYLLALKNLIEKEILYLDETKSANDSVLKLKYLSNDL